jgi:indolepyruvate ferredoxin oxidoreductase
MTAQDISRPTDVTASGVLLSGVETLTRMLVLRHQLDQRDGLTTATLVSGYPGSPLGTFDLTLDRLGDQLAAARITHRPGLNEELAAATVWGSQMGAVAPYSGVDGVAGVWYGKTPGLDRSGDVLKHANAMGAGPNGGVVMFCGDDPTAKSSTLPCDSQYTFQDACIPVLVPGDQQDIVDLGVHAFRLSRYAGPWVGLKVVTTVADGIGTVDLDAQRHTLVDPGPVLLDGAPWSHQPQKTIGPHAVPGQEILIVSHRLRAAQQYARANALDRVVGAGPGARLGIICAGKTYFDLAQALADRGIALDELPGLGIRVLRLGMTYPLVEQTAIDFAASVEEILVIEEKRPFIESQLRGLLHEAGSAVRVVGKRDGDRNPLVSEVGELDPAAIDHVLARVRPDLPSSRPAVPARRALPLVPPSRAPGFCSGCPHNRSTVFPADALVGGGVGCHGIMYFEARHQGMHSLPPTPMGAEGVPWIGLAPFVADPHVIQNLGDGTLSHSGSLAIRASVAAGADITFKILYNRAVAMTGGQDVTGLLNVPALTRMLEAEGVRRIVVCAEDPRKYGRRARWAPGVQVLSRDRLPQVQDDLRKLPGVSVIIYDQQCAAEARRLRKRGLQPDPPRRVVINEAVCEGCGDCSTKSNCLSVLPRQTEFGEKRTVHDPSCNRDYTCLEGDCPSFVTLTPRPGGRRSATTDSAGAGRPDLPTGNLPAPDVPAAAEQFSVYFTGIGGTGVVTANRLLAAAARVAGYLVGGLDQTGLSQKAGAVVSHLHFARDREALGAATVSSGTADLYLSGDILQAASEAALAKIAPGRTLAVIDSEVTPTAAMLQQGASGPAVADLEAEIRDRVGDDRTVFVPSKRIAEAVFANPLLANVILLGAAFQRGGLPLSAADIDTALGGEAGNPNRTAFAWGRWVAHDPAAVESSLAAASDVAASGSIFDPSPPAVRQAEVLVAARTVPKPLRHLLIRRTAQAIDYQDSARGRRFLDLVTTVAARDDASRGWALTRTVAESWFRLLTYKDEYEVARLHLLADYDGIARELGIVGSYDLTYHLHPPVLRRLGMRKKLPMGRPYEVAFHALRNMRRLRGTPLDVFGWDRDRRTERAVIEEYDGLMRRVIGSTMTYDGQLALAESPLTIKGYGPIKQAAVERWRAQVARLLAEGDPPR